MPAPSVDYAELMGLLSRPRPSGSRAEQDTLEGLQRWLEEHGIPHRLQPFTLYPYFFICIGLWMIVIYGLLALGAWLRWGWLCSLLALLGILGGLLDVALDFPLVTWPGKKRGDNLLMEFSAPEPERELVLSAHYDSKTELFDHRTRLFFVKNLRLGIALALLLALLAPLDAILYRAASSWSGVVHLFCLLLTLPLLFLSWGLGLNLSLGRLRRAPSQGAVDNGAACAILLGLAQRLSSGELSLSRTRLTLALFAGEEVNMQGSRAYALGRAWSMPAAALNLEVMAQDGEYVYWEQDGTSLKLVPTDARLNQAISAAVAQVTGAPAHPAGPLNSDGYSFLRAGVPATTLGTYHSLLKDRGFHLPSDNLERVVMRRLPEAVEILAYFIRHYDLEPQRNEDAKENAKEDKRNHE